MDSENPVTQTLAVSRAKPAKGENSVAGTQNEQQLRRSGHSLNSQKRNSSDQRCRTETKGELGEILFSLLLYLPPLAEFAGSLRRRMVSSSQQPGTQSKTQKSGERMEQVVKWMILSIVAITDTVYFNLGGSYRGLFILFSTENFVLELLYPIIWTCLVPN